MAISLTPLVGAHDSSRVLSYLLEIDDGRILLDCGCTDRPSGAQLDQYLQRLAILAPELDLVLLSHPLLSSLGLVPHLRARLGLRCPIYATLPTKEMGRWAVEEWIGQRALEESNGLESKGQASIDPMDLSALSATSHRILDGIEPGDGPKQGEENEDRASQIWKVSFKELRDAFDGIVAVRYSQPIPLGGRLRPLTLTAHKSGHTIGGTIWSLRSPLHIVSSASSSTLIYAPIFNHVRERHLDSAALVQATGEGGMRIGLGMSRPMVMVVGTERSMAKGIRKKDRDAVFLESITQTLRSSHSVLIPTDPSARLIELLLILDHHWTQARLDSFPLCLVSQTGKDVVTFIRSLTEWMSPALAKHSFNQNNKRGGGREQQDQGPLRLRHVRFFNSVDTLETELPVSQPKLIITTPPSLEYGYSRNLFVKMAPNQGNLIVLTSSSLGISSGDVDFQNLAGWLARTAEDLESRSNTSGEDGPASIGPVQLSCSAPVEMRSKVILEGKELEDYLEEERKEKERRSKTAAMLARSRQVMDEDESDESATDSDSETEADNVARTLLNGGPGWDEFVDEKEPMAFDIYVKGASATRFGGGRTQRYKMFPVVERRRKVDGYGEVVDVEGWLRRGDAVDEAATGGEPGARKPAKEDLSAKLLEPPVKFVTNLEQVEIKCSVLVIDLEGKADGRALKTIVPQINPKTIVLINGSATTNANFVQTVTSAPSFTQQVFIPVVGEQATVGHDIKSCSVRLGDSVMNSIRLSQVEGFEVAQVGGCLQVSDESTIPNLERSSSDAEPPTKVCRLSSMTDIKDDIKPDAETLPSLVSVTCRSSIFIGDIKLAALKMHLVGLGMPAEFAAEGVLVCGPVSIGICEKMMKTKIFEDSSDLDGQVDMNEMVGGTVAVRKTSKSQVAIEGVIGITFLFIRQTVYNLHARTKG